MLRCESRREEKSEERRRRELRDGCPEITRVIPGSGTQWLDPRDGWRDGWRVSPDPTSPAPVGHRETTGVLPWKRNQRLLDVRDSGIGTGGTHGSGLTGAAWIPEACRSVGSGGVDASIPMSGGIDWTRGGRVSRYSPIMDGQPSQSPSRMLETPGMGVKRESASRQRAGVQGTVIRAVWPRESLGRFQS